MVKVGILGAGFMGTMHAGVYSQLPDVKLAGIADVRPDKAKSLAEKYKSVPYYSVDEILKKEDIAVIDVCLPTFLHKEFVIKASQAGKDVVCEKPIALTVEDANEMISTCARNRVRFMVAQVLRFWPEYKFLKEMYERGKYGKLVSITCQRLSPSPTWGWQNWLMNGQRSGGALIDLHIHDTDFLLHLLGSKPHKIYSRGRKEEGVYVHILTTFAFPGVLAVAEGGWDFPPNFPFLMAYTAKFEKATVEFNSRNSPSLAVYEAGGKIDRPTFETMKAQDTGGNISDLGGYYYELRYFIEHVTHNKPFGVITPEQARDSLAIVLKEQESADTGRELTL